MSDKTQTKTQNNIYFPNLNGIRFIAAFSVMIHHIEQAKWAFGIQNLYSLHIIKNIGKLGVCLFFVLSGFLITYLLLSEKNKAGTINTTHFYMRRVLRIWPLYFLIVILTFFVFPHIPFFLHIDNLNLVSDENVGKRLSLFLLILPNLAFILYDSPYLCSQTWSIGVEELFYYVWPWFIKYPNLKSILLTIAIFAGSIIGITYFYVEVVGNTLFTDYVVILAKFLGQFRILTLVFGGIIATLVYYKKQAILSVLYRQDVQIVVYLLLILSLAFNIHPSPFNLEYYAFFFAFFILNLSSNPKSIINLEHKWISYLGKISYGLYIYQTAMTVFSIRLLQYFFGNSLSLISYNILLYTLAISLTVGVSALSFHFFERRFLSLKRSFS